MSKLCLFLVSALIVACESAPATVEQTTVEQLAIEEEQVVELIVTAEPVPVSETGRPVGTYEVSTEVYDQTLVEVKEFIDGLNRTIRRRDFSGWKDACSAEYYSQVSSREFLDHAYKQSALLQSKLPRLRDVNAYFENVVVPSRANSRVDEIAFEAEDRVKAYYLATIKFQDQTVNRWLTVYDLIRIGDEWKILRSVN